MTLISQRLAWFGLASTRNALTAALKRHNSSDGAARHHELDPSIRTVITRRDYRFAYPEFLPDPNPAYRNAVREKLERRDMLARRRQVDLPEFYVGSIVAVTVSDPNAPGPSKAAPQAKKCTRFVGIVIDRGGCGLRAWFIVRNIVEGQGVEITYRLYSPLIQSLEVLRLERRLDDELYYLRDCPAQFSAVDPKLLLELLPESTPVPVNEVKVPLNPKPWSRRWERYLGRLHGFVLPQDEVAAAAEDKRLMPLNTGWHFQVLKYDLLYHYRSTIPIEEQDLIWAEVGEELETREKEIRRRLVKKSLSQGT